MFGSKLGFVLHRKLTFDIIWFAKRLACRLNLIVFEILSLWIYRPVRKSVCNWIEVLHVISLYLFILGRKRDSFIFFQNFKKLDIYVTNLFVLYLRVPMCKKLIMFTKFQKYWIMFQAALPNFRRHVYVSLHLIWLIILCALQSGKTNHFELRYFSPRLQQISE